jgi:hypothetical protein
MFFNRLKGQFRARRSANNGDPISVVWVGDDEVATLVNPDSGRMYAYVVHDGHGKCHVTVVVSPWRALHLIRHTPAMLVSLLSFPRCTVELFRLKTTEIESAKDYAEYGLGFRD